MELFDKKYVHFMWEDELEGKEGFFDDYINDLHLHVNNGDSLRFHKCKQSNNEAYPFCFGDEDACCSFFYCDPNYEIKRAYNEGKQIQVKSPYNNNWVDIIKPDWDESREYRIKPEEPKSKRMTYRQLAEWMAKGNGQYRTERSIGANSNTYLSVYTPNENKEVDYVWEIRRWGSDEWIEPLESVYLEDCK